MIQSPKLVLVLPKSGAEDKLSWLLANIRSANRIRQIYLEAETLFFSGSLTQSLLRFRNLRHLQLVINDGCRGIPLLLDALVQLPALHTLECFGVDEQFLSLRDVTRLEQISVLHLYADISPDLCQLATMRNVRHLRVRLLADAAQLTDPDGRSPMQICNEFLRSLAAANWLRSLCVQLDCLETVIGLEVATVEAFGRFGSLQTLRFLSQVEAGSLQRMLQAMPPNLRRFEYGACGLDVEEAQKLRTIRPQLSMRITAEPEDL